jgi:hypothetical protein
MQELTPQQALQYALENGGIQGAFSHIHSNPFFNTKVTFNDGSEMFFGDQNYTVSIN